MKVPKFASRCDGCGEPKKARFRTLVDRHLCDGCCYRPVPVMATEPHRTGSFGPTPTVNGKPAVDDDVAAQFDLSHLTGGK